jgi:4-amino-4-deoxy-L-arabinose transferase-like glycosyltransferase
MGNRSESAPAPGVARDLGWLLLGLGLLYLVPTGLRPLSNPDEGRYVEIAREMVASGDWVSPRLNGLLFFEKPPLFYWLEASAVTAGGTNLWALRAWPIALALLGVAAVYGTGRTLWGRRAGWWAGWALGTSLLYYGLSQVIILDMAVSVFITWALCAFVLAVPAPPGGKRRLLCYALYASMALALLTKGLIGAVIPGAVIFLWLLLLNRWRELRHASLVSGVLLLLMLAVPWHILAALANPPPGGWQGWAHFFSKDWNGQGFLWYYFWHEHVLRYVDPATASRVQPWWIFGAVLAVGFLPWMVFLPSALRRAGAGGWARLREDSATVALLLWALFPLLFFSFSSSKLIPYILPSVPPLALLTGRFLAEALAEPGARPLVWPMRVLGGLSAAAGLALPLVLLAESARVPVPAVPWLWALAAVLLVGGGAVLASLAQPNLPRAGQIAGVVLVVLLVSFNPLGAWLQRPSTQPLAAWLKPKLRTNDRVFTLLDYGPFQDLPVYLGQTVGIAGQVPEEQLFGAMLEEPATAARYPGLADYLATARLPGVTPNPQPNMGWQPVPGHRPTDYLMDAFLKVFGQKQTVYVVVAADQYQRFRREHPGARVFELWHDDNFVLFSNQPPT